MNKIIITLIIALFLNPMDIVYSEDTVNLCPKPDNSNFRPRLGKYLYRIDFNGISIGTAEININQNENIYKVQIIAQTINTVDRIYRIRYTGESTINTEPFTPIETIIKQQVRSKEKNIIMKFDNEMIETTEKKLEDGDVVSYETTKIKPDKYMLDPFSASYLIRTFEWKKETEKIVDVFPGKSQYELYLKCEDLVNINIRDKEQSAWVIVPRAINLNPEKQAEMIKKRQPNVKIYISADSLRDVLKIEVSHLLGNFMITMEKFEPKQEVILLSKKE
jgi:hypothetical protein